MAGEGYEQENQGSQEVKRHEREARHKQARMPAKQQIPTPGTLEYRWTGSTRRYPHGYECKWATNTVAHILENREYTGCLVNFKTEKVSYKVKLSANRLVHVPICRHI